MIVYRGWIIHERLYGGFDATNPTTGQWFSRPTLHAVKWMIGVHVNFLNQLGK